MRQNQKPAIDFGDLDEDTKAALHRRGLVPKPRRKAQAITAEKKRSWALKVLAVVAELPQADRRRVLEQAIKTNEV